MLYDIERKILRIIENHCILRGDPPSYKQLSRFTGRSEFEVRRIVLKLKREGKLDIGGRDTSGRRKVKTDKGQSKTLSVLCGMRHIDHL